MANSPYLIGLPVGLSSSVVIADIAARSGFDRAMIVAVFVAMLDQSDAGCLDDWDPDPVAAFFGLDRSELDLIVAAMHGAGLIRNRVFVNWPALSGEAE